MVDPLSLVVGIAAGGIVAAIVAINQSKAKAQLQQQLDEERQRFNKLQRDGAAMQKSRQEGEKALRAAKEQAEALQNKLKASEATAAKLSKAAKDLESGRAQAIEEGKAHLAARQQAEGKARHAQTHASEAVQRAQQLEAQVAELNKKHSEAAEAAERRTQDVQRLRSQLASSRGGTASGLDESLTAFNDAEGSLDRILQVLLDHEGQHAAVVADANGIVVAGVGEKGLKDGMAAAARVVSTLSTQLDGMVPFDAVRSFQLQDANAVIAGRTFFCAGETVSLATYGPSVPADRVLDGAMANLNAALDG